MSTGQLDHSAADNVVMKLRSRLAEARRAGFRVRMELLDGEQATWCEIAGMPTLFVDLSQTAAEQLRQVEQALGEYASARAERDRAAPQRRGVSAEDGPETQSGDDSSQRAA